METEVRPVVWKALLQMSISDSGNTSSVRLLHPENAYSPITSSESERFTSRRLVQPEKERSAMAFTAGPRVMLSRVVLPLNKSAGRPPIWKEYSSALPCMFTTAQSMLTEVSCLQLEKPGLAIFLIFLPQVNEVMFDALNALSSISSTT